jgi:glucose/arabinose dehydrogenase
MNALLPSLLLLAAALAAGPVSAQDPKVVTVARGLVNPWALAFLPDGRLLVSERAGRLRIVGRDGKLGEPLAGLPPIAASGQCGLLDVVLDPKFAETGLIFWTFAEPPPTATATAPRWPAAGWPATASST